MVTASVEASRSATTSGSTRSAAWWKNNSRKDRTGPPVRYALLLSLRTREHSVDLYTPIANELRVPVAAAVIES